MRFAPKLSKRDRLVVERALPRVLAGREVPVFAASCTTFKRLQIQVVVLLTRDRFVGIDEQGVVVQELATAQVTAYEVTKWMTLTLTSPDGTVKFGTLYQKDVPALKEAIAEVCPSLPGHSEVSDSPGAISLQPQSQPAPAAPVPSQEPAESTESGLVDGLSRLAELHAQGALTAAEYEAAKRTMLEPAGPMVQQPSPVPPSRPQKSRGPKVKEMERTCRRDGTIWFVPLDVARAPKPSRMLRGGLGLQELADTALLGPSGTTASTQLGRIDAKWARAQAARQCPECGSQAFTERVVRH